MATGNAADVSKQGGKKQITIYEDDNIVIYKYYRTRKYRIFVKSTKARLELEMKDRES